jgi:hypothetical protein
MVVQRYIYISIPQFVEEGEESGYTAVYARDAQ